MTFDYAVRYTQLNVMTVTGFLHLSKGSPTQCFNQLSSQCPQLQSQIVFEHRVIYNEYSSCLTLLLVVLIAGLGGRFKFVSVSASHIHF